MSATHVIATPADPLEVVLRSPALVKRHDKDGWLALFTADGVIEDPVGAGAYVGAARHRKFWDAFIAPNEVTFHPRRDFRSGSVLGAQRSDGSPAPAEARGVGATEVIVRYVTISSVTPVSAEPFELEAIIEYVVRGEQLASLRAFWEPRLAVGWHARQGARGLLGLSKHGLRMTGGLGLKSAMGFSRALVPQLSRDHGRALAEKLASAIGGSHDEWRALTRGARVTIGGAASDPRDAEGAWDAVLERAPKMTVEESIVAGDHLACVLASADRAAAVLARVEGERIAELRLVWSVS